MGVGHNDEDARNDEAGEVGGATLSWDLPPILEADSSIQRKALNREKVENLPLNTNLFDIQPEDLTDLLEVPSTCDGPTANARGVWGGATLTGINNSNHRPAIAVPDFNIAAASPRSFAYHVKTTPLVNNQPNRGTLVASGRISGELIDTWVALGHQTIHRNSPSAGGFLQDVPDEELKVEVRFFHNFFSRSVQDHELRFSIAPQYSVDVTFDIRRTVEKTAALTMRARGDVFLKEVVDDNSSDPATRFSPVPFSICSPGSWLKEEASQGQWRAWNHDLGVPGFLVGPSRFSFSDQVPPQHVQVPQYPVYGFNVESGARKYTLLYSIGIELRREGLWGNSVRVDVRSAPILFV